MLPRTIVTRKTRWVWIAFLVLSPLAYLAGVVMILKNDPHPHLRVGIDRDDAAEIASRYAASKGVEVRGWDNFCRFRPNNDLLFYYRSQSGADRDLARQLAPEATIDFRFRSPDKKENIEVQLGEDGRVLGYTRNLSKSLELVETDESAARKIAEEAVKSRLASVGRLQPVELKPSESPQSTNDNGQVRRYVWRWPLPSHPELKLESVVSVRGKTLVGDIVKAEVDGGFAKRNLHAGSTLHIVTSIIYGLITLIVVVFGIYRFIQRTRQKEVSYSRVWLLTLMLTAMLSSYVLLTDAAIFEISGVPDFPLPDLIIIFSSSMFYLVVAVFFGLAYGSAEGDIREAYPGKLSSLDALLTGRLVSRNVARSTISGFAFGGWMLLCTNAVLFPWLGNPTYGRELLPLDAWFGKAPWFSAFMSGPLDMTLVLLIGLLIPLPLLQRRLRSPKYIIPLLSVFILVACSAPYLKFRPWTAILAMAAVRTFFIMLAFFRFDLLTALAGIGIPTFVGSVTSLMAQPSHSLRSSGAISLTIALIAIVVELYFAFKGRLYREDEVRPIYAKNLAERLSMQAEVTAAREAQKRLMPNELPQTSHFSIAATCLPAFEVGGDFYDLFEIEPGKLGVLLAEGGGAGLGSALSIAFAKGFLMPKIKGGMGSDDSPSEVLRGLQDRLLTVLAKETNLSIAYAVIDVTDGTLRYARTAECPFILIEHSNSTGKLVQAEERILRFKSAFGVEEDVRLIEGTLALQPGDNVIFFTDGIAKEWADHGTSPHTEFNKLLAGNRNGSTGNLQDALSKAVNECSKRSRKSGVQDDLTSIIVRLEKFEAGPEPSAGEEKS